MKFESEINLATELALLAGKAVMNIYEKDFSYIEKSDNEGPVTEADHLSNHIICEGIKKKFPQDYILSEEIEDEQIRLTNSRLWCIDPLDGTKDFIVKNDEFSIQIGLIADKKAVAGVVYLPALNKLYYASSHSGAFLIDKGIKSKLKTGNSSVLSQMTMIGSRSHRDKSYEQMVNFLSPKHEIIHGSVGAKTGFICEGKADYLIYLSPNTKEWDTCAPEIILEEAGGKITDLYGKSIIYNKPNVRNTSGFVASNGKNHEAIIKKLSEFINIQE
ncbi:MAG: hypothetical protein ACD_79C01318G0002 [uncultured bacterium]|nr:MAG: hypothetical protein ACD_79C01318G0002 [uncultured bacterium]